MVPSAVLVRIASSFFVSLMLFDIRIVLVAYVLKETENFCALVHAIDGAL